MNLGMSKGETSISAPIPLISIVIAVLNGEKTLQKCLDSIAGQTFKNIELIVVDGGSSDQSVKILKENSGIISYWESNKDEGIAHAWNKGIKKSSGNWIIFLGADDCLHDADVLAEMAVLLSSDDDNDVIYGKVIFADGPYAGLVLGAPFVWEAYRRRMLIPHTGCFQRRKLFRELGEFDQEFKIATDYEFFLRKPLLKAKYAPRLVTLMGYGGVSSNQKIKALKEGRLAQIKNSVDSRLKIEMWHAVYQIRNLIAKITVK
jgi:glycosyltransferase involved in cell wall biosynthesis